MPCKNSPPCGSGYVQYRLSSGSMCCRKARKSSGRKSTGRPHARKTSTTSGLSGSSLASAKKKLKSSYSMMVNGKPRAPPFISTLTGVTGHGMSEKIANLRRTLSTCKKMGVPLMRSDGKKFKTYRTLVGQCGVTFTKTPKGMHLSNLVAKRRSRQNEPTADLTSFLARRSMPSAPPMGGSNPIYFPPEFVNLPGPPAPPMGGPNPLYKQPYVKLRGRQPPALPPRPRPNTSDYMPLSDGPLPDLIDLSGDDTGSYVPPPLVMYGRRHYRKHRKGVNKRKNMEFGKRRRVRKHKKSHKVKKVPKSILKMCRKLKIKTTMKRGSKRVPKKLSILKKQIKMKMKMMKKMKRHHRR